MVHDSWILTDNKPSRIPQKTNWFAIHAGGTAPLPPILTHPIAFLKPVSYLCACTHILAGRQANAQRQPAWILEGKPGHCLWIWWQRRRWKSQGHPFLPKQNEALSGKKFSTFFFVSAKRAAQTEPQTQLWTSPVCAFFIVGLCSPLLTIFQKY